MGDGQGLGGTALTVKMIERAAQMAMNNFGRSPILIVPSMAPQRWESAPAKRRALTAWKLIGFLRQLKILDKEYQRPAYECEEFLLRMQAKKIFTRKKNRKYKELLRRQKSDEDLPND